jgi:hypothetical protein
VAQQTVGALKTRVFSISLNLWGRRESAHLC